MGRWVDTVHVRRPANMVVLDMDSGVRPTHGDQEGAAYNGHFGWTGPATIPCSCSTRSANLNGAPHARATPHSADA